MMKPKDMKASFVPITTLSYRLGLPQSWLKAEAKEGRIPFLQAGNRMMFNVGQVERVLVERSEREQESAGQESPLT